MSRLRIQDIELAEHVLAQLQPDSSGDVIVDIGPSSFLFADESGTLRSLQEQKGCSTPPYGKIIKTMRNLERTFSTLLYATRHGRYSLQDQIHGVGLHSMNEDILQTIFEFVQELTNSTENLQLVCRSFRQLALRTPRLWTRLDIAHNPTHYLARSRTLSLDIRISDYKIFIFGRRAEEIRQERARLGAFVYLVRPHASRWRTLVFLEELRDIIGEEGVADKLASLLSPGIYPALQMIKLHYNQYLPFTLGVGKIATARDFFCKWEMPALEILSLQNHIPSCFQAPLRELELGFRRVDLKIEVERLVQFLQACSALKKLRLEFEDFKHDSNLRPDSIIMFEQLEELTLSFSETSDAYFARDICNIIHVPNLRCLWYDRLYSDSLWLGDQHLVDVLTSQGRIRWPKLESLNFKFFLHDLEFGVEPSALFAQLTKLPRISSLSFRYRYPFGFTEEDDVDFLREASKVKLSMHPSLVGDNGPSAPPLRVIILENSRFCTDFLKENVDVLSSPIFEELILLGSCQNIDIDVVRSLLPVDKVMRVNDNIVPPLPV